MDKIEIWIPVIVAIVTSTISYIVSRSKSKKELDALKFEHQSELEKMERTQKHEIDKINVELEKQADLYEQNAQIDVTKDIMGDPAIREVLMGQIMKQFK